MVLADPETVQLNGLSTTDLTRWICIWGIAYPLIYNQFSVHPCDLFLLFVMFLFCIFRCVCVCEGVEVGGCGGGGGGGWGGGGGGVEVEVWVCVCVCVGGGGGGGGGVEGHFIPPHLYRIILSYQDLFSHLKSLLWYIHTCPIELVMVESISSFRHQSYVQYVCAPVRLK